MIDLIPFVLGFIVYVMYGIYTFDMYSKKKEITSFFILFLIYIYYSILAGYIINFVDFGASLLEKAVQIFIYFICGGFFMYSHYTMSIKEADKENYSGWVN